MNPSERVWRSAERTAQAIAGELFSGTESLEVLASVLTPEMLQPAGDLSHIHAPSELWRSVLRT